MAKKSLLFFLRSVLDKSSLLNQKVVVPISRFWIAAQEDGLIKVPTDQLVYRPNFLTPLDLEI